MKLGGIGVFNPKGLPFGFAAQAQAHWRFAPREFVGSK